MKLPRHISLTIEHQPQAANQETAASYFTYELARDGVHLDELVDRAEMERLNEVWHVHWYPITMVGSYSCFASTLELALAGALRIDAGLDATHQAAADQAAANAWGPVGLCNVKLPES